MIHPSTELRLVSPHVGYGVFASRHIPKGSLVYVQDPLDIKITPQQYQRLDETPSTSGEVFVSRCEGKSNPELGRSEVCESFLPSQHNEHRLGI